MYLVRNETTSLRNVGGISDLSVNSHIVPLGYGEIAPEDVAAFPSTLGIDID
jgi:hypothetical protein